MRVSIILLAAVSLLAETPALAQTSDPETPPTIMPLEDARSAVYAQDKDRFEDALSALEEFAIQGNAAAMLTLGDLYAQGALVEQDKARAIQYYERSADAESGFALYRLAEAYRTGSLVEQDRVKAADLYQKAAAKGIDDAKVRYAQALLNGEGVDQDPEQGLASLNELADDDNQSALNALGIYYASHGDPSERDGEKAVSYLERSSSLGNLFAKVRLAEIYADGNLVPEDDTKALELLTQAGDQGLVYARYVAAAGHLTGRFGKLSDAEKGRKALTDLAEQGHPESTITLADAYYWGKGTSENVEQSLSLLRQGAARGEVMAIQRLAMLLRDAPGKRVQRDLASARTLIEDSSDILPPAVRSREHALLAAADANDIADFDEISNTIAEAPAEARSGIIAALANTNPNAFVYVAQKRLQAQGVYSGSLSGLLTRSTIRSMQSICDGHCRRGPLYPEAVRHLSVRLAE